MRSMGEVEGEMGRRGEYVTWRLLLKVGTYKCCNFQTLIIYKKFHFGGTLFLETAN